MHRILNTKWLFLRARNLDFVLLVSYGTAIGLIVGYTKKALFGISSRLHWEGSIRG